MRKSNKEERKKEEGNFPKPLPSFTFFRPLVIISHHHLHKNKKIEKNLRDVSVLFQHPLHSWDSIIVYYVPRRTMRVIARPAKMLAGDRSRGAISPTSIVASLVISHIVYCDRACAVQMYKALSVGC